MNFLFPLQCSSDHHCITGNTSESNQHDWKANKKTIDRTQAVVTIKKYIEMFSCISWRLFSILLYISLYFEVQQISPLHFLTRDSTVVFLQRIPQLILSHSPHIFKGILKGKKR